jgi:hypothetical protein
MKGDVVLGDIGVRMQGDKVEITCHDLLLDSAERRKDADGTRRALVHDESDGLTINPGSDYPGGVRIWGPILLLRGFVSPEEAPQSKGSVKLEVLLGSDLRPSDQPQSDDWADQGSYIVDLGQEIVTLRSEIAALRDRIVKLEKRP